MLCSCEGDGNARARNSALGLAGDRARKSRDGSRSQLGGSPQEEEWSRSAVARLRDASRSLRSANGPRSAWLDDEDVQGGGADGPVRGRDDVVHRFPLP